MNFETLNTPRNASLTEFAWIKVPVHSLRYRSDKTTEQQRELLKLNISISNSTCRF